MSMIDWEKVEQDKYDSKHFLVQVMNKAFLKKILSHIEKINPNSILDIGCGEGEFASQILRIYKGEYIGTDLSSNMLKKAKKVMPVFKSNVYNLSLQRKFDLVICLEVLEHLRKPKIALKNIKNVSDTAIISVPFQKLMSLGNLIRGKYIKTLGRYPDHINSWNYISFKHLLKKYFKKVYIQHVGVWLIALVKTK